MEEVMMNPHLLQKGVQEDGGEDVVKVEQEKPQEVEEEAEVEEEVEVGEVQLLKSHRQVLISMQ